jgi:hypothetical protein
MERGRRSGEMSPWCEVCGRGEGSHVHGAVEKAVRRDRRYMAGHADGYGQGQRDSLAARVLAADDPEPAINSVVLDGTGCAWQRYTRALWRRAGSGDARMWEWVRGFGPVTLIYDAAIKGGNDE